MWWYQRRRRIGPNQVPWVVKEPWIIVPWRIKEPWIVVPMIVIWSNQSNSHGSLMRQYYNWWFLAASGNYNSWFLDASGTIIHSTLTKQGTSFLGIIAGFHWLCWGRLWSKKFQPSLKALLDPSPCFRGISGQIFSILKPTMQPGRSVA